MLVGRLSNEPILILEAVLPVGVDVDDDGDDADAEAGRWRRRWRRHERRQRLPLLGVANAHPLAHLQFRRVHGQAEAIPVRYRAPQPVEQR